MAPSDLDDSDAVYNELLSDDAPNVVSGDTTDVVFLDTHKETTLKPKIILTIEIISLLSFAAFGVAQDIIFKRTPPLTVFGMRFALFIMAANAMRLRFSLASFDVRASPLSADAASIGMIFSMQAILNFVPILIALAQNEIQSADTVDVTLGCFELCSLILLISFLCNGMRDFKSKVEAEQAWNCESFARVIMEYIHGLIAIVTISTLVVRKIWCPEQEMGLWDQRPRLTTLTLSVNLREYIIANSKSCLFMSFLFGLFVIAYNSVEYKAYWLPYVVTLTISQSFLMYFAYSLQTLVNKSNPDKNSWYRGQASSSITLTIELLAAILLLYKTVWSYLNHS